MRREFHVRFCEGGGVRAPSATRLVILCRRGKAEEALQRLREIMGKLKLTVNEEKTRICKLPEGEFGPDRRAPATNPGRLRASLDKSFGERLMRSAAMWRFSPGNTACPALSYCEG